MKRSLFWIPLASLALLAAGCAEQNAPLDRAHPQGWVLAHGTDPGAGGSADSCRSCHGADLGGGGVGVACLECHLEGPPFRVHPASWEGDAVVKHQTFAAEFSWTTCATAACHGVDLKGGHGSGETGPSCFSASVGTTPCHAGGPPAPASHETDRLFILPDEHGPLAKGRRDATDPAQPDRESGQLYCRNCHGLPQNDFDGGFVAQEGILDDPLGQCSLSFCHPSAKAHPTDWIRSRNPARSHSNTPDLFWGDLGCGLCHETPATPGPGAVAGAPSCFGDEFNGASCHGSGGPGSLPHAIGAGWLLPTGSEEESHVAASLADPDFCLACHVDSEIEPACTACHTAATDPEFVLDFVADPGLLGTCDTCHAVPPAGASRPNRGGAHGDHAALTASTADCSACHAGAGTGSAIHFDEESPADVAFSSLYDARTGTAGRNADGTCGSVSCHGGQTTPAWLTGQFGTDRDDRACRSCHGIGDAPQTPQFNSYYSGAHRRHAEIGSGTFGFSCLACHDGAKLAPTHFASLDTPAFNSPATTLADSAGYDGASCVNICHPGGRSWED